MKLASLFADAKALSLTGWTLIAVFYFASLGMLILQMIWYYNHPILYWVYVFLHLLVFLFGLYAVTTATGWQMLLTTFILSLILGLVPYDAFLPALADTVANPSLNEGDTSGKIFIDVMFRLAIHFIVLCLGGIVLRRFMVSLSTGG